MGTKTLITPAWPFSAAQCRALEPLCEIEGNKRMNNNFVLSWHKNILALSCHYIRGYLFAAQKPKNMDEDNSKMLTLSVMFTKHPLWANSACIVDVWPFHAAQCSGLHPYYMKQE